MCTMCRSPRKRRTTTLIDDVRGLVRPDWTKKPVARIGGGFFDGRREQQAQLARRQRGAAISTTALSALIHQAGFAVGAYSDQSTAFKRSAKRASPRNHTRKRASQGARRSAAGVAPGAARWARAIWVRLVRAVARLGMIKSCRSEKAAGPMPGAAWQ